MRLPDGSGMNREVHVPFCEKLAGKFRRFTHHNLHWTLDVVFNEDQSGVRKDHAGENMAIVRHIVINMLNKAKGAFKGVGLKALRKKAGWDNATLSFVIKQGVT